MLRHIAIKELKLETHKGFALNSPKLFIFLVPRPSLMVATLFLFYHAWSGSIFTELQGQESEISFERSWRMTEGYVAHGQESSPSQSQSDGSTDSRGNLTRQDLDPIITSLFSSREHLLRNNIVAGFEALNTASGEIFKVRIPQNDTSPDINLEPLQRQVEFARGAVLANNVTQAFKHLNAADTQFIIMSQKLSSTENNP